MDFDFSQSKLTGRIVQTTMQATCAADEVLLSYLSDAINKSPRVKIIVVTVENAMEWEVNLPNNPA